MKDQYWVVYCFKWVRTKMNGIVNKFLLARDKFMPQMHLIQPGFTYVHVGHLL